MKPQDTTPTHPKSGLGRRQFLRVTGAAGLLTLAGAGHSQAFFGLFGPSRNERYEALDLPKEWRDALGPNIEEYALFLDRLRLRHITVRQIVGAHVRRRRGVSNQLPPRSMWRDIRGSLRVADALVERVDAPLESIISAYRSPAYNARCPGASPNSYHTRNVALDLRYRCPASRVTREARRMRDEGRFEGGIGSYGSFTHIDTRGRNATW